jgi:hypothetical protein
VIYIKRIRGRRGGGKEERGGKTAVMRLLKGEASAPQNSEPCLAEAKTTKRCAISWCLRPTNLAPTATCKIVTWKRPLT